MDKKYTVVDLFSGAGGFLIGFEKSGYNIMFSTDIDGYCEAVHKANRPDIPFLKTDIRELTEDVLDSFVKSETDVLIGGPPCQGFSTIGSRISSDIAKRTRKDPRNVLFKEYIRILEHLKPKIFLMENVVGLLTREKGRIFEEIEEAFENTGYDFHSVILNAVDYGVPQIRNRVFFYGNNINAKLTPPPSTHGNGLAEYETVKGAIGDLASQYTDVQNHVPLKHGEKQIARYRLIPEGGRLPEDNLPEELYRKNFGNTFKRLHRDKPSLTMVPGHNAFPIHPWLDRSLTVREAARIQTFDDDYVFMGPRDKQCMQVGNAVPPVMAKAWADYLKGVLDNYYEQNI